MKLFEVGSLVSAWMLRIPFGGRWTAQIREKQKSVLRVTGRFSLCNSTERDGAFSTKKLGVMTSHLNLFEGVFASRDWRRIFVLSVFILTCLKFREWAYCLHLIRFLQRHSCLCNCVFNCKRKEFTITFQQTSSFSLQINVFKSLLISNYRWVLKIFW
jgi:hypothetical protein